MPFISSYADRYLIIAVINKEVGDSDFFFVPCSWDVDYIISHWYCWTHFYSNYFFFFSPAPPNITMPIPGTAVRTVEGRLTTVCEATGTSPVYVALMWNSIVLVNETDNAVTQLYLEGNYHCIATNNYGTDTRVIPVFVISKEKMSVPSYLE